VDFGLRRAHGSEAGLLAARAAYVGGFDGTATVLAGARFGIPIHGTMAHSYVLAHDSETQAFADFPRDPPSHVVLPLDTFHPERAAARAGPLAHELAAGGTRRR